MARKRIDITGFTFGKLTVLGYSHTSLNTAYWDCECECGSRVVLPGKNLKARAKTGNPQGCGCQKKKYPLMGREDFKVYQSFTSDRKWKFGLTEKDLRTIMDNQKGCCGVCGRSLINPNFNPHDCHIDHDHSTGIVRGYLCHNCNAALGFALDSPEILTNLKRYLND